MANIIADKRLRYDGEIIVNKMRHASFMPYKTGFMKNYAVQGGMHGHMIYAITFNTQVAPYITFLEEGTRPHDIPGAFGRPLPFGIGGRFSNKFHPGSTKHKDWIKKDAVKEVLKYYMMHYDATISKGRRTND